MDAPLFICTKEEQRAVIQFLWTEIVLGAKMPRRMSVQYGDSVMSQQIVYEWIERLRNGHTSSKHEEGGVHPSASLTDANAEQVFDMILQNRQVTIVEVAHQLQISHGSAYEIIHKSYCPLSLFIMGPKAILRITQREMFGYLRMAFGSLWC